MAAPLQISAISTQYVAVPVTDLVNRLPADPTSYAVSFAFLANGTKPTASTVFYSGAGRPTRVLRRGSHSVSSGPAAL